MQTNRFQKSFIKRKSQIKLSCFTADTPEPELCLQTELPLSRRALLTTLILTMRLFMLLTFFHFSAALICPPDACEHFKCRKNLFCPSGRIRPKAGLCGCCDGCVTVLSEADDCRQVLIEESFRIAFSVECDKGLKCDERKLVCVKDPDGPPCTLIRGLKYRTDNSSMHLKDLKGQEAPPCSERHYEPKQCMLGMCFCVSSDGEIIHGYTLPEHQAVGQTCVCARDEYEYHRKGLMGKTFRCDYTGSYDPIQCLGSVCYCSDRYGRRIPDSPTIEISRGLELECDSHKLFS